MVIPPLEISAPGLGKLLSAFQNTKMTWRQTRQTLEKLAEITLQQWKLKAMNPEAKQATWFGRQYANSLSIKKRTFNNREMSITVGPTGDKGIGAAKVVELGRERYDMKPALLASPRARSGKNGPYTIIGFRHGMKVVTESGMMQDFQDLKTMKKTGSKIEVNAYGGAVRRNVYDYSSAGLGKRLGNIQGHYRNLSGMVKTQQPVGKDRGRGATQSQAITFRVVSARSTGWVFPAIPAQKIAKEVMDEMKFHGSEQLKNAVKADILAYLTGSK